MLNKFFSDDVSTCGDNFCVRNHVRRKVTNKDTFVESQGSSL